MAGPKEKKIINRIEDGFRNEKYKIKTTVGKKNTELKIDKNNSYNPDILFEDKKEGLPTLSK